MKITWIGQAGLYLEAAGMKIIIDPYLSDSVSKLDPKKARRVPVDEKLFDICPDVLLFTHQHLDHYDPETAEKYLAMEGPITVLAPMSCWQVARKQGGRHNYVLFDAGVEWTEGEVCFTAVPAVHSDAYAIGIIIEAECKRLYVAGDTLYSQKVLSALPQGIDVAFLPVNGVGNNMNGVDAARFAKACGAKRACPVHIGLMDDLKPQDFHLENQLTLNMYQPVVL